MNRLAPLVLQGVFLCACVGPFSEDFESHYPDVPTARQAGAFERGWLPEFVPPEATDISEKHNIDTNVTWACFSTPAGPGGVRSLLQEHGATRVGGPVGKGPGSFFGTKDWWPSSMTEAQVEAYRLAESSRFTLVVGIDPVRGRVCFHRS